MAACHIQCVVSNMLFISYFVHNLYIIDKKNCKYKNKTNIEMNFANQYNKIANVVTVLRMADTH